MASSVLATLNPIPARLRRRWRNRATEMGEGLRLRYQPSARSPDQRFASLFVAGYYHTGTRWMHSLIAHNTPPGKLYAPTNQHGFIDDNARIQPFRKHGQLSPELLRQRRAVIIYLVRDFDSWAQSFLNQPYEARIADGVVTDNFGWPKMPLYDLYAHITRTNVALLRASSCAYVVANLAHAQASDGLDLLALLSGQGVAFTTPPVPVQGHTKSKEHWARDREEFDLLDYKTSQDEAFEAIINDTAEQYEYRFDMPEP